MRLMFQPIMIYIHMVKLKQGLPATAVPEMPFLEKGQLLVDCLEA
jgi:hypothetical protein